MKTNKPVKPKNNGTLVALGWFLFGYGVLTPEPITKVLALAAARLLP